MRDPFSHDLPLFGIPAILRRQRSPRGHLSFRSGSGAAAEYLRSHGLEYGRLRDLMHGNRFILPRRSQVELPRVEDLLGPLGEQLTRLYGQAGDNTRLLS